jgi:glutamate-5-semialdehyde dehydrogenase
LKRPVALAFAAKTRDIEAMDDAGLGLRSSLLDMGRKARAGADALRLAKPEVRTRALLAMAERLRVHAPAILAANAEDLAAAKSAGLTPAMLDRLGLTPERIEAVAKAVEEIAAIPDPVGREDERWTRPNGLDIARVSTPIGVIAMIYEARPNVTADAAALCVRSGNAVILRGGSECLGSALAIHGALIEGLQAAGLPAECVQIVTTKDREAVGLILEGLNGAVDLLIPRGGKGLVARVNAEARAPVLSHEDGVNHVYIHAAADPQKARAIALNAKMRRVSVCGAAETLLIDAASAGALLPAIAADLIAAGCALRGDLRARSLVPAMTEAHEEDWRAEYLDAIFAVRVVDGLDRAIAHIETYGSHHTDAIVTEDAAAAEAFAARVDSAIVLLNASTQFADGGEFGFGGEIGIATGRLHARGPVGAQQLQTYKYVVRGSGQTRP